MACISQSRWTCVLGASALALVVATTPPAFAQRAGDKMVDEVTVEGRIPRHVAPPVTYSVGYADLDLSDRVARDELNRRVRVAGNYVCEAANAGLDVHLCQTRAIMEVQHGALPAAIRDQPRPFAPGPSWTPPPGRN